MANLRIVLVEPREAGNVGAAARVIKNFGFRDLTLVGERPAQMKPYSEWWASGAADLVTAIEPKATLFDAVHDAQLTVATTSARGRVAPVDLTPREVAKRFAALGEHETLALVFGREDRGLTREETMLCQQTAVIPTARDFPVMNLAQSVAVFCYELSGVQPVPSERRLAPAGLIERLHERVQSFLLDIEFLHEANPDRIYEDLRVIAGRAALDEREVTILLGIARQLEWKLRQKGEA